MFYTIEMGNWVCYIIERASRPKLVQNGVISWVRHKKYTFIDPNLQNPVFVLLLNGFFALACLMHSHLFLRFLIPHRHIDTGNLRCKWCTIFFVKMFCCTFYILKTKIKKWQVAVSNQDIGKIR